jgi:hypothetical protein
VTRPPAPTGQNLREIFLALAACAVLCILVLSFPPRLVEPDDYAYRASIVAMTQGRPALAGPLRRRHV